MNKQFLCVLLVWVGLCCADSAWAWHSLQFNGRCKQSGFRCDSTIGNAGGQGACCDPQSPNLATCATQDACTGGIPYKWPNLPVTWSFNANNMAGKSGYAGMSTTAIEAALKQGWDAWTKPACTSFRHSYQGQSNTRPSTGDRRLVNYLSTPGEWSSIGMPPSVLAVTNTTANTANGNIVDGDILFNPTPNGRSWGLSPNVNSNALDFTDVTAHEVGHALGFGHTAPRSSLMYYAIRGLGPQFKGLSSDEESGVCAIYPSTKCTSDSQCGTCRACTNGSCGPKNLTPLSTTCKGCKSDADCQGGSCTNIGGVFRCLQACDAAGCCPSGTTCKVLSGKQLCAPNSNVCPDPSCTSDSQCGTGEVCRNGNCTKACQQNADCAAGMTCQNQVCAPAPPANLGQPCSTNIPCVSGTSCQQTSKGQICTVPCGAGTGGFPQGSPGSSCTSCASGTTCGRITSGIAGCVHTCTSTSQCASSGGGECMNLNGVPFCFCTKDIPCQAGYTCNTSALGAVLVDGQPMGACAKQGGGKCPTGYQCSTNFCVPTGTGNTCGNGQCDGSENCGTCAQDCKCSNGQTCQNNACVTPATCGNGKCDGSENCGTCARDCPCPTGQSCQNNQCKALQSRCGDGICDGNENCTDCPNDCTCPAGFSCQSKACKPLDNCGNGVCDTQLGENCATCAQDCACPTGQLCFGGACGSSGTTDAGNTTQPDRNITPTPDNTGGVIDLDASRPLGSVGGRCFPDNTCAGTAICVQQLDGTKYCLNPTNPPQARSGCQCNQTPSPIAPTFLLLLALAMFLKRRG